METLLRQDQEVPLKGVRSNIVQSIRAYRVNDLQEAAQALGHHFLYANLAEAQTKQDVLDMIGAQFTLPTHFGKNFDALYDCMTDRCTSRDRSRALWWCSNRSRPTPSSTRKPVSNCSTSSATRPSSGAIARSLSGASILFCSPFCTH